MDIFLIVTIFLVPSIAFGIYITNYKKYNKVNSKINKQSSEIARIILAQVGLEYVGIEKIDDSKSDHYNMGRKIIYLTKDTYKSYSLASINIAAFECSHAVQDVKGDIIIKIKSILYPIFRFITTFSYWVAIFGFVLHWDEILYAAIGITMVAIIFNLLLLYIEFDAAKKAIKYLTELKLITDNELLVSQKFLKAYCFKNISELMTNSLRFYRLILINEDPEEESKKNINDINLEELKNQNTEIVLSRTEDNNKDVNNK